MGVDQSPTEAGYEFHPGTQLAVLSLVDLRNGAQAICTAIEGPGTDELTLHFVHAQDGGVDYFTLSAKSDLIGRIETEVRTGGDHAHVVAALLSEPSSELRIRVADEDQRVVLQSDPESGSVSMQVIDVSDKKLIAAILGQFLTKGFEPVTVTVLFCCVVAAALVTRHRENMRAIELCVPVKSGLKVELNVGSEKSGQAGLTLDGSLTTHKTEQKDLPQG
jgi:hypothetical protein